MIWFLVAISEILLILLGIVIVAMSYELPQVLYPNNTTNPPLDNPTVSSDNNSIEIDE
jgi:hypothetical protein